MKSCLAAQVDCDYTSLRGKKESLTAKEHVALRKSALELLQTQHLFSNLEIDVSNDGHEARCRCSALILRRREEQFFNTHAIYEFTCVQKISDSSFQKSNRLCFGMREMLRFIQVFLVLQPLLHGSEQKSFNIDTIFADE